MKSHESRIFELLVLILDPKLHSKRVEKIEELHSKRVEKIEELHSKRVEKTLNILYVVALFGDVSPEDINSLSKIVVELILKK